MNEAQRTKYKEPSSPGSLDSRSYVHNLDILIVCATLTRTFGGKSDEPTFGPGVAREPSVSVLHNLPSVRMEG
jgi:hypothetical protein